MSGNPLDRIPVHNRVSIRAVLVHDGEDPGPALRAAGILNPIAIPVVVGEDLDLAGGILGDGITPNLIGVLEPDEPDDFDASAGDQAEPAASRPDPVRPAGPITRTAPDAFGMRSFAPIRRLGDTSSGRFGDGAAGFPPEPGRSLEIARTLTSGWRKPRPYVRFDPVETYSRLRGAMTPGDADAAG